MKQRLFLFFPLLLLPLLDLSSGAAMKMYEKTEEKLYQPVLVPVSSTVIPLDDLPVYKVGAALSVVKSPVGKYKPDGPIELITIHSKNKKKKLAKKDAMEAVIEELSKDEYEKSKKNLKAKQ